MKTHGFRMEQLEDRSLLAVTAAFASGSGILTLTGDSANDDVAIEGTGVAGRMRVFFDGNALGTFSGVRSVRANLGSGNDTLSVAAIHIGGDLTVTMGAGADVFNMDNTPDEGNGPDGNMFIGNNVSANMGNNAGDLVSWVVDAPAFDITIGGNVALTRVADVDLVGSTIIEGDNINIGGSLTIGLSNLGDINGDGRNTDIADITVGNTTVITGSNANDQVFIANSTFVRRVTVNLGAGDDRLDLDNGGGQGNTFQDRFTFNGGSGNDTFDTYNQNQFAFAPVLASVENVA